MLNKNKVDKVLLSIIIILTVFGIFTFLSASLGLLAKEGARYSSVVLNQLGFGLIGGLILMFITSKIPYKFWKIYSFWIFLGAVFFTLLVFIPGIGFEFAGAKRWILIGPVSIQPSELLKFTYLFYVAGWLSYATAKKKIKTLQLTLSTHQRHMSRTDRCHRLKSRKLQGSSRDALSKRPSCLLDLSPKMQWQRHQHL
jgi:cell division protein FtsW (lipid II flippase)